MNEIHSVVARLRQGGPIILLDSSDREGEGDLAFAASACTPSLVNLCLTRACGLLCVAMWPETAERLGISRLATNGRDPFGTPFSTPISLADHNSGVSASSRSATIRATSDPAIEPSAFSYPGHVPTLIAHSAGLRGRPGHTEAILEALRIAHIDGPGAVCEILNAEGEVATEGELRELSSQLGAPVLRISTLIHHLGQSH